MESEMLFLGHLSSIFKTNYYEENCFFGNGMHGYAHCKLQRQQCEEGEDLQY